MTMDTLPGTKAMGAMVDAWAAIRGLHHLLWTAHWLAEGDPAYGDHLLFERLYTARVKEIDAIAEQLMLIGGPRMINPAESWQEAAEFINAVVTRREPTMVATAMTATSLALSAVNKAARALRAVDDDYSPGAENLMLSISQSLNEALYLLKRRARVA
jgi:DNA-binding ferritin-like protein